MLTSVRRVTMLALHPARQCFRPSVHWRTLLFTYVRLTPEKGPAGPAPLKAQG